MTARLLVVLFAATLTACAPTPPAPSPSPSASPAAPTADVEGCEHLASGPATAVTASTIVSSAGLPPRVANDHRRYDIALKAASAGDTGTTVEFESDEAGDVVLFLNKPIPVKVREVATSREVAFEASATASTVCGDVKARHVVPLGVGVYTLEFGPTTETQVSLVIEEAGDHGDHDHE